MLALPDVRQKDSYDCGEAAVKCVLKYYEIYGSVKFATAQDGSDPRMLEAALRLSGLNVTAGEMCVADLKHWVKHKKPIICLIWYAEQLTSHYVVVSGFNKNAINFHDVETGPVTVSLVKWKKMWTAMGRLGEPFKQWGIVAWP